MSSSSGGNEYVGLQTFIGGESQDSKFGGKFQYDYGRHIDVRARARGFSVLPGTAKASGGVVTDLVLDMEQVPDGTRYAVGNTGNIYRVSTSGTWSLIGNIGEASGAGISYRSDVDMLYISGQTKVSRIANVTTAPKLQIDWFASGISTATSCTQSGSAQQAVIPTAINESLGQYRPFVSDIEPLQRIGVVIPVPGTGDMTMTIHDDANNVLGVSSVVTNAAIKPGQVTYFVFPSPVRLQVSANNYTSTSSGGRTYHFHVTSTAAGGKIQTLTDALLSTADMELWATALVPTVSGLHPITQFAQYTLIGNEKYVAAYAPLQDNPTNADFQRHRLTFPAGYETNGIAQLDLYAAITAERRSTNATQDFQEGKMFLWDGIQTTYNRYYDIPEGAPEGIFSHKNVLQFVAAGALYQSSGGQPVKIRTFRNTETTYSGVADSTHIYPHMMTVRRGILLIAYPSFTTNVNLEHGVYGFGQLSREFPMSWSLNYSLSTGSRFNTAGKNLRIGMIRNFGDTLYQSWRDDTSGTVTYGVDVVNNSSAPAPDFEITLLTFDMDKPYKEKLAKKAFAVFDALPADGSVTINMKYRINREATYHYQSDDGNAVTSSGNVAQVNMQNKQFLSTKIGLEGTVTGSTSPFCSGIFLLFDPQPNRTEITP